tara:strand:- start:18848 stop:23548 length:4701 start_codon:yes stop_codon:yes gene_type:complete
MAQKPANVSVNTTPTPTQHLATVGKLIEVLRDETQTQGSRAAEIAFTNPDTSARYQVLAAKGLNNLRSELIAVCEFLPIGSGDTSEDSAQLQFTLGDNNSMTVNNIARVIELHRQIRSYILETANQILTRVYPDLSDPKFLKDVEAFVKNNFENLLGSTIDETVTNIFERIQQTGPRSIRGVVTTNQSNPFLLALIEYYIYDNALDHIFVFLGTTATVDRTLSGYWGIDRYRQVKMFNPPSSILNSDMLQLYSNLGDDYSSISRIIDTDERIFGKSLYGFNLPTNASNTDSFCNAIGSLASAMSFRDSTSVLRTLQNMPEENSRVDPGKVRIGSVGDLAKSISLLKNINFAGMFAQLPAGVAQDETSTSPNITYTSSRSLSGPTYTNIFNSIKSNGGTTSVNESSAANELLATVLIDMYTYDVCNMNSRRPSTGAGAGYNEYPPVNIANEMPTVGNFDMSALDVFAGYTGEAATQTYLGDDDEAYQGAQAEAIDFEDQQLVPRGGLYFDFIRKVLGSPETAISSPRGQIITGRETFKRAEIPGVDIKFNSAPDANNLKGFGAFGAAVGGLREQIIPENFTSGPNTGGTTGGFIAPLESSSKELKTSNTTGNSVNFPPATKYYIMDTVSRLGEFSSGDINFDELKDFGEEYKETSNNLLNCVSTLFPHEEVVNSRAIGDNPTVLAPMGDNSPVSAGVKLLKRLVADLNNIIDSPTRESRSNYIPLLSVFTRRVTEDSIAHMCCQVFFDQVLFNCPIRVSRHYTELDGAFNLNEYIGSAQNFARISLYHSERMFRNYLKYNVGLSFNVGTPEKFYWSESDLPIYLASDSQLLKNNQVTGKINSRKVISHRQNALNPESPGFEKQSYTANRVDNAFEASFGNKGGMDGLQQDSGFSKEFGANSSERTTGFSKLFDNYFRMLYKGNSSANGATLGHTPDEEANAGPYIGESSISKRVFDTSQVVLKADRHGCLGGIIDYSAQHRIIAGFRWLHQLITSVVMFEVKTKDNKLEIYYDIDQLRGIVDGLLEASGESLQYSGKSSVPSYDDARTKSKNKASSFLESIRTHIQTITDRAAGFCAHADALVSSADNTINILEGRTFEGEVVKENELAVSVLKDLGIFGSSITLNSRETVTQFAAMKKRVYDLEPGKLFPASVKYNLAKNKLMTKVLSQPGYGFLANEKFGRKSILNIGLPNSMVSSLQKIAYDRTGDVNFLDSPYVCISIFKKDHINPELEFLPKNFIFDTSANILDYEKPDKLAYHLRNITANISFENILRSMQIFRYELSDQGEALTNQKIGFPVGMFNRQVMINHVHDYCLKEYMKLVLGIDTSEESFLLTELLDFTKIESTTFTSGASGNDLVENFKQMLARIERLYPKVQSDEQLRGEVFRLTRMLKQSAPYSFVNRFKKVISPKSFDKVYSIFINENDFVIDLDFDNTIEPGDLEDVYSDVFEQEININVTSKLERPVNLNFNPSQVLNTMGNENFAAAIADISNYAWSGEENVPGVFQYKAQVSLLPLNFQIDGDIATLKKPSRQPQVQVSIAGAVRPNENVLSSLSEVGLGSDLFKI